MLISGLIVGKMQGPVLTSTLLIPFILVHYQDLNAPISDLSMPQRGRPEKTSPGDN